MVQGFLTPAGTRADLVTGPIPSFLSPALLRLKKKGSGLLIVF